MASIFIKVVTAGVGGGSSGKTKGGGRGGGGGKERNAANKYDMTFLSMGEGGEGGCVLLSS